MYKIVLFLLVSFFASDCLYSQELNCKVIFNQMANTTSINRSIFNQMEIAINNFINSRKWTTQNYDTKQKIDCTMTINLTSANANNTYKADFTIQATRPVYYSSYNSPIIRFIDKGVAFQYIENQPMDFSINQFNSNLTSALAYYCNFIIAMENETFSNKGGQDQFDECQTICMNVPSGYSEGGEAITGWSIADAQSISGQKTRIGIALAYLNSSNDAFREAVYNYHIKGLDVMAEDPKKGTEAILNSLRDIKKTNNTHFIIRHFVLTKVDEIINIFKDQPKDIRKEVGDILSKIEPIVTDKVKEKLY